MRFKKPDTPIPTIDLIPMLTVMMGVLAFFVVISVSLSSEQLIQVNLPPEPTEDTPTSDQTTSEPFIVSMDADGQQRLNGVPIATDQLTVEINAYLDGNPTQNVYLVPSRELPYEQVMRFLGDVRAVGGSDRVSLALEKQPSVSTERP
ncbi:MAG: biopolymer transporter ExbD [Leptolyngbya foveolarum]|uniref:Biopolymer transporter ExbD n=1 Tax=Leptolyngbya foveolarum TaxID=47253 RepID=A0A2W4WRD6_9CYAN|nr:MAG: biopolymer transporter ExbD [Leptolyngbya foveolarum]